MSPNVDDADPTPISDDSYRWLAPRALLGCRKAQAEEGPLETTTVRILRNSGICLAPQYVADELLRAEGFTDVRYVDQGASLDLSSKVGQR